MLGNLVSEIGGIPLEEFLHSRIFEPLGMVDTFYRVPDDKRRCVVTVHRTVDGELVEGEVPETVQVRSAWRRRSVRDCARLHPFTRDSSSV